MYPNNCEIKVRYSANHNLLRTVGFVTMLCAVLLEHVKGCAKYTWYSPSLDFFKLKHLSGTKHAPKRIAICWTPLCDLGVFVPWLVANKSL